MIKVHYDTETTLVKGYYPDFIKYKSIPEPFIEIEDNAQILNGEMCVVNGVYQEYVKPDDVLLEEEKLSKISQIKQEAERRIVAIYPDHKQRNILMSQNDTDIQSMNIFISNIRTKSNEIEASLYNKTLQALKDLVITNDNL